MFKLLLGWLLLLDTSPFAADMCHYSEAIDALKAEIFCYEGKGPGLQRVVTTCERLGLQTFEQLRSLTEKQLMYYFVDRSALLIATEKLGNPTFSSSFRDLMRRSVISSINSIGDIQTTTRVYVENQMGHTSDCTALVTFKFPEYDDIARLAAVGAVRRSFIFASISSCANLRIRTYMTSRHSCPFASKCGTHTTNTFVGSSPRRQA